MSTVLRNNKVETLILSHDSGCLSGVTGVSSVLLNIFLENIMHETPQQPSHFHFHWLRESSNAYEIETITDKNKVIDNVKAVGFKLFEEIAFEPPSPWEWMKSHAVVLLTNVCVY